METQVVKVVGFEMPFKHMVVFMVKWVLAAIPAALLLLALACFGASLFAAFVKGV